MRMPRRSTTVRLALLAATLLLVTGCGDDGANGGLPASGSSASIASSDATGNGGSSLMDRIFDTSSAPSMVSHDVSIDDSITGVYGTVPGADSITDPTIDSFDENPLAAAESDFDDMGGMAEFDYASAIDDGGSGLISAGWEDGAASGSAMGAVDMTAEVDDELEMDDPALDDDMALDDEPMDDMDPMLDEG